MIENQMDLGGRGGGKGDKWLSYFTDEKGESVSNSQRYPRPKGFAADWRQYYETSGERDRRIKIP